MKIKDCHESLSYPKKVGQCLGFKFLSDDKGIITYKGELSENLHVFVYISSNGIVVNGQGIDFFKNSMPIDIDDPDVIEDIVDSVDVCLYQCIVKKITAHYDVIDLALQIYTKRADGMIYKVGKFIDTFKTYLKKMIA